MNDNTTQHNTTVNSTHQQNLQWDAKVSQADDQVVDPHGVGNTYVCMYVCMYVSILVCMLSL